MVTSFVKLFLEDSPEAFDRNSDARAKPACDDELCLESGLFVSSCRCPLFFIAIFAYSVEMSKAYFWRVAFEQRTPTLVEDRKRPWMPRILLRGHKVSRVYFVGCKETRRD